MLLLLLHFWNVTGLVPLSAIEIIVYHEEERFVGEDF